MAPLSNRSLSWLVGAKDVTIQRANQLAAYLTSLGGDLRIAEYGGYRDAATQQQLVEWRDEAVARGESWYPVASPGASKHETGDAFDVDVLRPATGYTEEETYKLLADYAPSIGLKAGYYFGGGPPSAKSDPFHFENASSGAVSNLSALLALVALGGLAWLAIAWRKG